VAYDEDLADRIRDALAGRPDVSERKMFGGIAFLLSGNMVCGVVGEDLMVRLGEEVADAALDESHTRPMDFTGKPMKSMVYVGPAGTVGDDELRAWVDRGVAFAQSLPPK
jgi:TfoX/Sxy family transcriptional regulator of competence genes